VRGETRFPEIREVCLQQLAKALCSGDRVNTTKNLMSAIRGSVHGHPESSIDPETRGAIFDMLANGYPQTSQSCIIHGVSRIVGSAPCEPTNHR